MSIYDDAALDFAGTGNGGPRVGCFADSHPLGDPELADAFLDQRDSWRGAGGYVAIKDMSPQHALNTVLYILQRSLQVMVVLRAGCVLVTDEDVATERLRIQYLLRRPLLDALMARAGDRAGAMAYPWERALRGK